MAHYQASFLTPTPQPQAFAYLSDFTNAADWDPGIVAAERVDGGPIGGGSTFRLFAQMLGRRVALTYRIVEFDPPRTVAFLCEGRGCVSHDRITFQDTAAGTCIRYDADLAPRGLLRLVDPLLGLLFRRIGDRARAGLREALGVAGSGTLASLRGRSLDGERYVLPGDLAKPNNVLAFAFARDQQEVVDDWLSPLRELSSRRSDVDVFEVPVLAESYAPLRRLIDGGMAKGAPDAAARQQTITVYTDVQRVLDSLGLADTSTVALVAVTPSGQILARVLGAYDQPTLERLTAAFTPAAV